MLISSDSRSFDEALTRSGIVLPNGNQLDLEPLTDDDATLVATLADELVDDPEAFKHRRCETMSGAAIPAMLVLQAAMLGHIRRVVVDSQGVVVDLGVKQRLFAGNTRLAAQWMMRTCAFPGRNLPASVCQIDHNDEWHAGRRTDQDNAVVECGSHNRYKHRNRLRTRRDSHGRVYHLKPDGTIMLPAGERPPDLTIDEQTRTARARAAGLHQVS